MGSSDFGANDDGGREPPNLFLEVHVTMAAMGRVPNKLSYVPNFYTSVATSGGGLLEPREHRPGVVRAAHPLSIVVSFFYEMFSYTSDVSCSY